MSARLTQFFCFSMAMLILSNCKPGGTTVDSETANAAATTAPSASTPPPIAPKPKGVPADISDNAYFYAAQLVKQFRFNPHTAMTIPGISKIGDALIHDPDPQLQGFSKEDQAMKVQIGKAIKHMTTPEGWQQLAHYMRAWQ